MKTMSAAKVDKHAQTGLKRTVPEGTIEETLELNKLYGISK